MSFHLSFFHWHNLQTFLIFLFPLLSLFIQIIILITLTRLVTCSSHFFPNYLHHHLFWYPLPSFLKYLTLLLHLTCSILIQLKSPTDVSYNFVSFLIHLYLPGIPYHSPSVYYLSFQHVPNPHLSWSHWVPFHIFPKSRILIPYTSIVSYYLQRLSITIRRNCIMCPLGILPRPTSNLRRICTHPVAPFSILDPVHSSALVGVSAFWTSVHK